MTTPLPRGIERDDTQHGKLYYTKAMLLAYGDKRASAAMAKIDASRMKNNTSGQAMETEDLMRCFGMKP